MDEYSFISQKRWLKRAVSWHRMRHMDPKPIPSGRGEVRLFTVLRDEKLRLPWFLDYYFNTIGVDRMFVVDNGSTDGSLELLLETDKVHVFSTTETYVRQEAWIDALLRRYGRHGWSIVIDVDEMLVYPRQGAARIRDLLKYLDHYGYNGMHAFQLDMYADKPLKDTQYNPGQDPLEVTPWFDRDSFSTIRFPYRGCDPSPIIRYTNGMRHRVFGLDDVCISKFPLIKYRRGLFLRQGTHAIEGAAVADIQAAILHFKFLNDFGPRTAYEADRGEHWNNASQYKEYARVCGEDPNLNLSYDGSVEYAGEEQLLELGIMRTSETYERYLAQNKTHYQ